MAQNLIKTNDSLSAFILRVMLGIVIFPHGAQKVLGWFGGGGFEATLNGMTTGMGLPAVVVILVMLIEFVGSLMLIFGIYTRVAALCTFFLFIGIIAIAHWGNGFFMNWSGEKAGEGYEYHLLVLGMSLALVSLGSGRWSVDRALARK